MKKLMMTTILATMMPILNGFYVGNGACMAGEGDVQATPSWPDIAPVYDSYYDYSEGILYIYGSVQYTVITVEVTHNGQTILMDVLSPNNLPAQYNFNGYDYGYYHVTISAGNTLLTSFGFNLL